MEESKYKLQLQIESENLDPSFEHAARLVSQELERLESGAPPQSSASNTSSQSFLEIHTDKPIKLTLKVKIPAKENPKFNFVGKLLGPKGNSLKRLQAETGTKMSILGRGSMRDKNKEDEMRKEGGKYAHLHDELHVLIEVYSEPTEAYRRMGVALTEVKKYLIPEHNDDIGESQRQEMLYLNGGYPPVEGGPPPPSGPPHRGRGRGGPPPPRGRGGVGGLLATPGGRGAPARQGGHPGFPPAPRGAPRGAARGVTRGAPRGHPPAGLSRGGARGARGGMRPPAPPPVAAPLQAESYDDYGSGYDDGSYAEQGYGDGYDQPYAAPAADTQYFDYGHGSQTEAYEDTYDSQWASHSAALKAPAPRGRAQYRAHPYGAGRGAHSHY